MKLRNVKKYFIKAEIWQKYQKIINIKSLFSIKEANLPFGEKFGKCCINFSIEL